MATALADLILHKAVKSSPEVATFDCDDDDLNDFAKNDCHKYQDQCLSHTRIASLQGQVVGFITLLADSIVLETKEKEHLFDFHKTIYQFPALKIGRLGVQRDLQRGGIGTALFEYAVGVAVRMNQEMSIGCRFITVDAYAKSISWYEKRGFVFNESKKPRNSGNRSMRYDLLKSF